MNKILFIFFAILLSKSLFSQTYGNEWINYNQRYYSFKIFNDGIYKIDHQTLIDNGINPSLFNSSNIQIFGREKEIPLYISDGGDNQINSSGDYILFYAKKNDAWLDSTLFRNPEDIGNPGKSMFNDTIIYFFTWNNSNNNSRFVIEQSDSYALHQVTPYCIDEYILQYEWGGYNYGKTSAYDPSSLFDPGEGFKYLQGDGGSSLYTYSYNFDFSQIYTGANAPDVYLHYKGTSDNKADLTWNQEYNHHLRLKMGNDAFVDTMFEGYKHLIFNKTFQTSYLQNNNIFTFDIVNDLGIPTDRQSLNYLSIKFPKKTNLSWANYDKFKIINNTSGLSNRIRLDITNSSINSPICLVFGSINKFINAIKTNDTIHALITNAINGQQQEFVIYDTSLIQNISLLKPVNGSGTFTNFTTKNFEEADLIITHPYFNSNPQIQANSKYITYRQQNYNVVDANIEELYLQFGGGIEKHCNALRRFAHYAYNHSTIKPIAITILGKGIRNDYSKQNASNFATNYIPPFGSPGSDMYYTSFLQGNTFEPLIPIGRISVISEQDLSDYLNKLIDYENVQITLPYTTEDRDWMKQVLHFIGGNSADQVETFRQHLEPSKNIIENVFFGGHVTNFLKYTNSPLDPTLLDQISNYIQYGASIMTFFGHSGSNGFDISVDDPVNWNNYKKYPVIFGNGCHAAAIYEQTGSYILSEKIIKTANNGGIAYFASGGLEYDVPLKNYMQKIYGQISIENYGKALAFQIKEAVKKIILEYPMNEYNSFYSTLGATNLNGDPLIKINYSPKPEIELLESNVTFDPQNITLAVDSFDVNIRLNNLGMSIVDTFFLDVKRIFPLSSIDSNYRIIIDTLNYHKDIKLRLPLQANSAIGVNNFEIKADIPSYIVEQSEEITNNQLTKVFYLKVDGILPVLPFEFAVVPRDTVRVVASTINPIAGINTYFFELDTTDLFNSPFLRKKTMIGSGGVKTVNFNEWNLASSGQNSPLICTDSTVYFWRVAVDSSTLFWNESSFQYIKGKEGWGQDHFFQFKKNNFTEIDYNRDERKRNFFDKNWILNATTFHISGDPNISQYTLNSTYGDYGLCGWPPTLYLAVIDPVTLLPWRTPCGDGFGVPMNLNQLNDCSHCKYWRSEDYFVYAQNQTGLTNLYNTLQDLNNNYQGYYVLLYTGVYAQYDTINQYANGLIPLLNSWGGTLNSNNGDNSFIFFTQIGNNSLTNQIITNEPNDIISLTTNIQGTTYIGYEKSTLIGPATEWKTVYWKQDPEETVPGDTTTLVITGINPGQNLSYTVEYDFTHNDSILNFNNIIDANVYPYLNLKAKYYDKINTTPAQVDRWHVLYSPVPEAAIDNTNAYTLIPQLDTIQEGQEFIFAADYKNISELPMDSMLVKYWIEDANHFRHYINYPRQDSLRIGETFRDTITINTTGFAGLNSLWMEINPYINAEQTIQDQLEQHHFNNILQIPFYVNGDDENPILDVTFDGRHILNGDIVNPKSEILISLKDDNPFLVMDDVSDTTLFGVFLTGPDGVQKKIHFTDNNGNVIMQWIPADPQYKKFKIIYKGNFEKDGTYKLLVQGSDRSGNLSGDLEYRITFEVINESSITYLMNYPNPFSTSTRFVFTLTGSEKPDDIIIQIMTITGKVIREITEDEIGPIYIGRNITQYAWNGTDEYGDPLANGVYLYRVLSRINGEEIKHRSTGADKYFKKEFGKMYLMR